MPQARKSGFKSLLLTSQNLCKSPNDFSLVSEYIFSNNSSTCQEEFGGRVLGRVWNRRIQTFKMLNIYLFSLRESVLIITFYNITKQVRKIIHIMNKIKYHSATFWKEFYQNSGKGSLQSMSQILNLRRNDNVFWKK